MSTLDDIAGGVFLQEAAELVQAIERGLMDLEQRPDDTELINAVFRDLHTVKGSGAMFGFSVMAQFVHEFETLFDSLRRGEAPVSGALIAVSLAACDQILALIEDPDAAGPATAGLLARLRAALGGEDAAAAGDDAGDAPPAAEAGTPDAAAAPAAAAPEAAPAAGIRLRFWLAEDALRLGHNPELMLEELRALGPARVTALTDRIPGIGDLVADACLMGWEVEIEGQVSAEDIDMVFLFQRDDMQLEILPPAPRDLPAASAPQAEAATALPVVAPVAPPVVPAAAAAVAPPAAPPAALPAAEAPAQKAAAARTAPAQAQAAAGDTTRVATERLDELMDRVGELVIAEARLQALARAARDPALMAIAEDIQRLAGGLRDTTMSMRMVPIGSILGRFRRLMRDLSGSLGKQIDFVTEGEETELDKTVIEQLADPIVHILRNSADHGLEMPADRLARGKPATGTITLAAEYSGAEVLISIRDDGKGLDPERIRRRAVEAGLIGAEQELAEGDLYRLIFEPGFSTAEAVTELSGRGVGMDVVKRTITGLRGQIDLTSAPGQGTTVLLRLPLTLAIIDGLLIEVAGERYAIPLAAVEECVELPDPGLLGSRGSSFLNIRGGLVPFLRLRSLFDSRGEAPEFQKVVVVSANGARVGLVVDRIIGSNQTVIKQLSCLHAGLSTFAGATILGDGGVALILDVAQIVSFGRNLEERGRKEHAA